MGEKGEAQDDDEVTEDDYAKVPGLIGGPWTYNAGNDAWLGPDNFGLIQDKDGWITLNKGDFFAHYNPADGHWYEDVHDTQNIDHKMGGFKPPNLEKS